MQKKSFFFAFHSLKQKWKRKKLSQTNKNHKINWWIWCLVLGASYKTVSFYRFIVFYFIHMKEKTPHSCAFQWITTQSSREKQKKSPFETKHDTQIASFILKYTIISRLSGAWMFRIFPVSFFTFESYLEIFNWWKWTVSFFLCYFFLSWNLDCLVEHGNRNFNWSYSPSNVTKKKFTLWHV